MAINQDIFLLAIRGALKQTALDEARTIHNQTAGNPDGVAAARSLGDLSHNVYVPVADAKGAATELLILDRWNSLDGLATFFSNPQVQAGGGMIFKVRDPVVWQLAADIPGFDLPTPTGKNDRFVGLIRGSVRSREAAKVAFEALYRDTINPARILGQVSHQIFYRVTQPGEPASLELLGVDIWMDGEGMGKFYSDPKHTAALKNVFTAAPVASVWKQPAGSWVEW